MFFRTHTHTHINTLEYTNTGTHTCLRIYILELNTENINNYCDNSFLVPLIITIQYYIVILQ